MEQMKDQLENDFEDTTCQSQQLFEECEVLLLTKEERFASDQDRLPVTKFKLSMMKSSVRRFQAKKEETMAEADHLSDEIDWLSKKV